MNATRPIALDATYGMKGVLAWLREGETVTVDGIARGVHARTRALQRSRRKEMSMFAKSSFLVLAASLIAGATPASGNESNVELCKRFYEEVVKHGKVTEIDRVFSADFVEHEPFPGLEANREGVKQFFAMMHTAFPDLTFDVDFYMADGDKVAAYLTIKGTHRGEFMGIEPTGRPINVRVIDIMRIEDGKFVEHWGVTDGLAMMEQLGAME